MAMVASALMAAILVTRPGRYQKAARESPVVSKFEFNGGLTPLLADILHPWNGVSINRLGGGALARARLVRLRHILDSSRFFCRHLVCGGSPLAMP